MKWLSLADFVLIVNVVNILSWHSDVVIFVINVLECFDNHILEMILVRFATYNIWKRHEETQKINIILKCFGFELGGVLVWS